MPNPESIDINSPIDPKTEAEIRASLRYLMSVLEGEGA